MQDCLRLPDPIYSYNKDEVAFAEFSHTLETNPILSRSNRCYLNLDL